MLLTCLGLLAVIVLLMWALDTIARWRRARAVLESVGAWERATWKG